MPQSSDRRAFGLVLFAVGIGVVMSLGPQPLAAGVLEYGDEDLLGKGTYPSDPKSGATLVGQPVDTFSAGAGPFAHQYPFAPKSTDYPGTDQIFVGANQTAMDDGYSQYTGRTSGPQVITMDYGSLLKTGNIQQGLTLGIATDDFQDTRFHNPFTATINGIVEPTLTSGLNSLNETGPKTQFFTLGIPAADLLPTNILTLSISEGGTGGDGWAIDFLTIGIPSAPLPGDVNFDGIVNAQDIAELAANWLHRGLNGDANNDDIINAQDIAVIASHWLQTGSVGAGSDSAVPEPSSIALLIIGAIGLAAMAWRRVRSSSPPPSLVKKYRRSSGPGFLDGSAAKGP